MSVNATSRFDYAILWDNGEIHGCYLTEAIAREHAEGRLLTDAYEILVRTTTTTQWAPVDGNQS